MTASRPFPAALRILAVILVLLLSLGLPAGRVAAQGDDGTTVTLTASDYSSWETFAGKAETAIGDDATTDSELTKLREDLVSWRTKFDSAQTANSAAISAAQAQLDTLGPAPESGEETEAIAKQRADLQARLEELASPARQAQIAYSRADALIQALDTAIRARQTEALLELGPSPLDPTKWPGAFSDLTSFFSSIGGDVVTNWKDEVQRSVFKGNLPVIGLLVLLALVLVMRGRDWIERLALAVLDQERTAARWLFSFIVSLGQIALPVLGVAILSAAAITSGLLGDRGEAVMRSMFGAGMLLFTTRWLSGYVFPVSERSGLMLELSVTQRREGRVYANVLGIVLAAYWMFYKAIQLEHFSDATTNVVMFPLLVVTGLFLLRLSRFLVQHGRTEPQDEDGTSVSYRRQLVFLLGQAVAVVSIAGPVLAAIGYFQFGTALTIQTLYTLELLALLSILQKLVLEIYVVITGDRARASEALLPVLLAFVLSLASIPIFALIWGARVTDLAEAWTRFKAGFDIGETHISPSDFMIFVVVFALGYGVTRMVQGAMKTSVLPKTKLDKGGQNAVISGLGYVGIFLAALIAITTAGIDLSSLAIVAGALSVGIGFGLQTIVQNFVSGIILLIERPISEGDWIEVGGQMGFVRSISVRSTRIETFDRTDVIVPNADLISGQVTNWTRGNLIGRLIVSVGVAYGTDTRKVVKILQEIAEEPPLVVLNPPPGVVFLSFGADSLNFEIRAILRDVTQSLAVKTEMHHRIAERFREEGIEIPFAQRDIWLRNPEALRPEVPVPVPAEVPQPFATKGKPAPEPGEEGVMTARAARAQLTQEDLDGDGPDGDGDADGGER